MSDIFISYASEDRGRAKQLAEVLTQQDWSVWWDQKISPGKTWAEVIEQQLDAARCVIVLWSRDSVASEWVKTEAREGKARGILIPILIEEAKIPLEFRHIQAANLMGWDPEAPRPDLNELLLELEQLLAKPKQRQQDLVPPERAREAVEALRQRLHALEKQAAPLRSWAPDAWARAEQCGQDAEVAWQEQRYPDATRLFGLALRAYAEAHSAAQDTQTQQQAHEAQAEQAEQDARSMIERERTKQEAEANQSQVAIIRERASEAEVEQYASGAFREAVHTERRGDTALSQGEYVQARELYLTAQQRYAQAQQQAEIQRQRAREAAEALRQRLHALEKEAAPLRSWVPDAWARAEQCGQEAEVAWQEERYPDATRLFGLALRAYAEAHSAAQDAQTQQQTHEAQAQAEQAEQDARSIEGSVQGLAEADKTMIAGKQAKSVQHWGDAVTAFTEAKEQYARIVFCYAEEARKSMEKGLASAEHQGVSAAPDALWQRARALVSEAEDLWNRQVFLKAGQTYSEAARLLDDITSEIERERAKQEAEANQSQVAIIRERASEAEVEKYASGAFREAVHTERRGDTALSQGEYVKARELYLTAQQRYAQAQQQAQVERQRREALSVQEQAQQAEQAAIAVGASGELELYRQGQAAREQGDAILARGAFAEAAAAHTQACRLYDRAAEMQRQRARAAAEAARERALIAQAKAQGGAAAEIFADQWAQAQTLLQEADTALSQDHGDTACAGFEKCAALFRHLYDQALVHIDQQQAEQARTQAFGLQRELGDAKGWRLARAKRALARGHLLFESTNYSEARSSYEKATALFTAWQQSAGRRTAGQAPSRIEVPWTKLYPALALGAIAIGVTMGVTIYIAGRVQVPESEPPPVPAIPETAVSPPLKPGGTFRDTLKYSSPGLEMVDIPSGEFRMGDIQGTGDADERPVRSVRIPRPFALGRYEVTFEEYEVFSRATNRPVPEDQSWGRGSLPVINVSWQDAVAYAKWLSEETGRNFRLPTEAEWEYAARAGTKSMRFWGDAPSQACEYANVFDQRNAVALKAKYAITWESHNCEDPYGETALVGSFRPNSWGLYDMLGNVWEWVQDCWHEHYAGAPEDGSKAWEAGNDGNCARRMLRGGSWNSHPKYVRSADRYWFGADFRSPNLGFRLAQDL